MKLLVTSVFFVILTFCKTDPGKDKAAAGETSLADFPPKYIVSNDSIKVDVYDFAGFERFLYIKDNKTYVINFWATWCRPCVAELPYFERLQKEYNDKGVEVILVSLDMPGMLEKKLLPFLREKKLRSKVVVLNDPKQNDWIPKVNTEWSGAIPATLIYNKENRAFYESSMTYEELENNLNTLNDNR
ncbi:TlpA disulfide reductase family protein [Sinomicrobium weinanense]|uniref:TlpA family protein disulfide reductase n=1 Tax=Sinomicrobium weinanense TaxID=2842200 RepID=A0A926Q458_9FLAO|nr:TlpA disulfide reductase family protein [Sinomicrobium weinanense]MBC9796510.1 TlpA family protein disulfide reductase [Sinomicrobium weinanense]MBU3123526.1 TlpA family protein disulfide reductase [Sinomicrobium weinanense]